MRRDVVIVEALRSPIGRRNGALSGWHAVELTAEVLRGLIDSVGLDPVLVDDVVVGRVTQVGAPSNNIARSAVLAAGWPESVPGCTVDRQWCHHNRPFILRHKASQLEPTISWWPRASSQ